MLIAFVFGFTTLPFFFFQAEDGIRDYKVTGVQTCALPICGEGGAAEDEIVRERATFEREPAEREAVRPRSEERRVGKECRSRGWPEHEIKIEERQVRTREQKSNTGQHRVHARRTDKDSGGG